MIITAAILMSAAGVVHSKALDRGSDAPEVLVQTPLTAQWQLQSGPQYWQQSSSMGGSAYSQASKPLSLSMFTVSGPIQGQAAAYSASALSVAFDFAPKRCEDRRLIQWPAPAYWGDLVQIRNAAFSGDWGQVLSLSLAQVKALPNYSSVMAEHINLIANRHLEFLVDYKRRLLSVVWP
ncbi:hypothetical protein [Pseudoteredinibacter isoporae]|uniref:hypothetical protein n=1 Tax=Pseudoteredinibacter isoporae TaxID=570281 RepID=UPI00333F0370